MVSALFFAFRPIWERLPAMHSPDDIHYALETTKVLREPDRRIDTFGETRFEFQLISELMDRAGEVRIRTGSVEAMRPRILRPSAYNEVQLEGFDPSARARFDKLVEKLRARHDSNAKYRAVIRGDKRLPAIEIQRVMSVIAQAGIDDISFSALNKE